jgi:hypothetical protein
MGNRPEGLIRKVEVREEEDEEEEEEEEEEKRGRINFGFLRINTRRMIRSSNCYF